MKRSHSIMDGVPFCRIPAEETIPVLPEDVWNEILHYSESYLVRMACVSRQFEVLTLTYAKNNKPKDRFDKAEWIKRNGDPGEEPPIPLKMYSFDPQRYTLTLIPETINNELLTLSSFDRFLSNCKNDKDAFQTNYYNMNDVRITDKTAIKFKTHWVLLSKGVVKGTRNEKFIPQESLVKTKGFEVPYLIDVVVTIYMHHLQTGQFIFPNLSRRRFTLQTYTRVQEKADGTGCRIFVGAFGEHAPHGNIGLFFHNNDDFESEDTGMACALTSSTDY